MLRIVVWLLLAWSIGLSAFVPPSGARVGWTSGSRLVVHSTYPVGTCRHGQGCRYRENVLTIFCCAQDLPPLLQELLSRKKLDRDLLPAAIRAALNEARMSEQLAERKKKDEAVAAERAKKDEATAELMAARQALSDTTYDLRQRNIEYLRVKGTVDVRSAMGE